MTLLMGGLAPFLMVRLVLDYCRPGEIMICVVLTSLMNWSTITDAFAIKHDTDDSAE